MQTVLIVDDMAVIRAPLAAALTAAGFRAITAESGPDALAKIRLTVPDLVLLDLTMPGMDGLSVLRSIRKSSVTAKLPVILLTASSAKDLVIQAVQIGIQDYLVKSGPMLSIVVARVQKCLANAGAAPGATDPAAPAGSASAQRAPKFVLAGIPLLSREETTRRLERAEVRLLPRAVMELIALISSGKGSVADAALFLQRDPVLFARLLRVANSAAVANQHERMTTLEEAITLFGVPTVQNLTLAVGVHESIADHAGGKGNPLMWHHCLAVGAIMEKLAPAANLSPGFAYVLGLCHELPEVLLHRHFPKHYRHATDLAHREGESLQSLQTSIFGLPHGELMRLLLGRMKFPSIISTPLGQFFDAVGASPTCPAVGATDPLAQLLLIADALAHGLMLSPSIDSPAKLIRATLSAALGTPPPIDPAALRSEVAKLAGLLAETANAGAAQVIEPMLPRVPVKLLYIRDDEYGEPDPLLLLLQATCESVTVHLGLDPMPTGSPQVSAVVLAAPAATPASELISLVNVVTPIVLGRPVLCLSAGEYARCDGGGADVKTSNVPLTLHTLGEFLKNVSPAASTARAA